MPNACWRRFVFFSFIDSGMCPFCLLFRCHLHTQSWPRISLFQVAFLCCSPAPPVFHSVFVFSFSVSAAIANKLQPHRTAVYVSLFSLMPFLHHQHQHHHGPVMSFSFILRDNITVLPKQNFPGCFQNIHKQYHLYFLAKKTTLWLHFFFLWVISLCLLMQPENNNLPSNQ